MELDCHTMIYNIPKKTQLDRLFYEMVVKTDKFRLDIFSKRKLRILGENFCRNNKNKGKLIINNKKSEIKEFINIENINRKQSIEDDFMFNINI